MEFFKLRIIFNIRIFDVKYLHPTYASTFTVQTSVIKVHKLQPSIFLSFDSQLDSNTAIHHRPLQNKFKTQLKRNDSKNLTAQISAFPKMPITIRAIVFFYFHWTIAKFVIILYFGDTNRKINHEPSDALSSTP